MVDPILTLLLMWHIGSVILWFGSSATFVVSVYPSLNGANQESGRSYLRSFLPRFSRLLAAATISAALAGILLFTYVSSINTVVTPTGWRLVLIGVGALLGMIAAFLTIGVAIPLSNRFLNPGSQVSNGPKYSVLDEATMIGGLNGVMQAILVMLSLAFVLMVTGAYP